MHFALCTYSNGQAVERHEADSCQEALVSDALRQELTWHVSCIDLWSEARLLLCCSAGSSAALQAIQEASISSACALATTSALLCRHSGERFAS